MTNKIKKKIGRQPATQNDVGAGVKLRSLRMLRGLSQTALGLLAKPPITFQQVQKYEHGSNRMSLFTAKNFAEALGKDVNYFFDKPTKDDVTERDTGLTILANHYLKLTHNNRMLVRNLAKKLIER